MTRFFIALMSFVIVTGCAKPEASGDALVDSAELVALPATDHVDSMAREPMLVETNDGTLYVTGYGEPTPRMWRSADGGRSWTRVNVGTGANGAIGNSDVDLAVAPDGTLYFVAMSYDGVKYEGTGISIAASRDNGATWQWTSVSRDRYDDRPWVEVAPNGTAHVIWNDGAGVSHAISTDRGETWVEQSRVHKAGGSSHFAISPGGALAVRITPLSASANKFDPGVDHVAISTDDGATWVLRNLPGSGQHSPKTRISSVGSSPSRGTRPSTCTHCGVREIRCGWRAVTTRPRRGRAGRWRRIHCPSTSPISSRAATANSPQPGTVACGSRSPRMWRTLASPPTAALRALRWPMRSRFLRILEGTRVPCAIVIPLASTYRRHSSVTDGSHW